MENVGARLVGRFGPEVEGWLAEVQTLAARLATRWGLGLGELFESGASSVVFRCQWPDGTPAVLKLSPDRALLTKQGQCCACSRRRAVIAATVRRLARRTARRGAAHAMAVGSARPV